MEEIIDFLHALLIVVFIVSCAYTGTMIYDEYGFHFSDNKYMFEKIAKHVAEDYEYKVHVFDCSEFSEELYNRLEYAGYENIRIQAGCGTLNKTSETADFDNCHAWVVLTLGNEEIHIESTSGEILSKTYYLENFPAWNYIIKS